MGGSTKRDYSATRKSAVLDVTNFKCPRVDTPLNLPSLTKLGQASSTQLSRSWVQILAGLAQTFCISKYLNLLVSGKGALGVGGWHLAWVGSNGHWHITVKLGGVFRAL